MSSCEPLQGDADLYGLGVRFGIYLTWTSSWITLILDPDSAQSIFDVNSIFVFTIALTTMFAAAQRDVAVIEMHLMLQIIAEFYCTTLSTLGFRTWFLSPDRTARLARALKLTGQGKSALEQVDAFLRKRQAIYRQLLQQAWASRSRILFRLFLVASIPNSLPFVFAYIGYQVVHDPTLLWTQFITYNNYFLESFAFCYHLLSALSPLKPPGLSWSGVMWRTAVAMISIGFNMVFWCFLVESTSEQGEDCNTIYVFIFSKQAMTGPLLTISRVAAVAVAVPALYTICILLWLTYGFVLLAEVLMFRDMRRAPQSSLVDRSRSAIERINGILRSSSVDVQGQDSTPRFDLVAATLFTSLPSIDITLPDLLKAFVATGTSRTRIAQEEQALVAARGEESAGSDQLRYANTLLRCRLCFQLIRQMPSYSTFCILWNIGIACTIAWFITSIECTIRWNRIEGVGTINTTGQLIPFVIGCVSAVQAAKRLVLLSLTNVSCFCLGHYNSC